MAGTGEELVRAGLEEPQFFAGLVHLGVERAVRGR